MQITLKIENIGAVQKVLDKLSGPEARGAYAKAINDTAYAVRREMQAEMGRVFDKPTSYILKSPWIKLATPDKLNASIQPTYMGGKGIDPQKILQAQEFGGRRADKRSESALRRVGILPPGYQTVIPKVPFPGSDDGRGNLRGPFLVQLISYFQAFGEQGYKANMTDKRKRNLHKGTAKQAGRRYFVAGGLTTMVIEGGERAVMRTGRSTRTAHLPKGIWAATGEGGKTIQPVLLFVRGATYTSRLNMDRISKTVDVQDTLDKKLRFRIREAAGV